MTPSHLKNADYHAAVDLWLAKHKPKTIFCFVQFKQVSFNEMPRLYLAHPAEVADRLKATAGAGAGTPSCSNRRRGATEHMPQA